MFCPPEGARGVEWQQTGPGRLDETSSTLRESVGKLTLQASGVPAPIGYGLASIEALAGLIEHEGRRLADAQR
jgi:hypothetical protein